MADLTHLDGPALQAFLDGDLHDFTTALTAIRKDDPNGVRSLKGLLDGETTADTLQEAKFLAIGAMAADDTVHGAALLKQLTASAQAVDTVFDKQGKLFKDIEADLRQTIKTLLKTQGTSLDSIDGAKLLDIFSDLDADMGDPGTHGPQTS